MTSHKKPLNEVEDEHYSISRIFGVTSQPPEKQYAKIATPFVKQR